MALNKDAGTKAIYEALTTRLRGDATLKNLMRYTESDPNIGRGFATTGKWKQLLRYYLQPESVINDFSPNIRQVPLVINIYNRINELELIDIGEQIIELLDNQPLDIDGKVRVYDVQYLGEGVSNLWVDELQANMKTLRFQVTFRKEI